jgi:hypothetical protein
MKYKGMMSKPSYYISGNYRMLKLMAMGTVVGLEETCLLGISLRNLEKETISGAFMVNKRKSKE